MATQVQWFGLKPILIDSVSGYNIPNEFSINSNKLSTFTGLSGPFRPEKAQKSVFPSKMAAEGHWFGLEKTLIRYISI